MSLPEILNRRLKTVRRRGVGFSRQSPEKRHRLRIALKKLRYALEMLAPLTVPTKPGRLLRAVKQIAGGTRRRERSAYVARSRGRIGGSGADAAAIAEAGDSGARLVRAASEIGRTQDQKTSSENPEEGLLLVEPDPDRPPIYAKIAEPRNGLTLCGVLPLAGSTAPERNPAIL